MEGLSKKDKKCNFATSTNTKKRIDMEQKKDFLKVIARFLVGRIALLRKAMLLA